jgi:hypothetical protein
MKRGGNNNHPKRGDRIKVDPIRKIKDIKAISKITQGNPRDHLLFIMGINNGLRAGDLVKLFPCRPFFVKGSSGASLQHSRDQSYVRTCTWLAGPKAPNTTGLHRSNSVLTPPHTPKRGQFNSNHPLKDVASKMPLILSLQK